MKIKLDENLPATAAEVLRDAGHDTDTIPEEGLAGKPDAVVWDAAQESGRFFITQDLDFSDLRRFRPGSHHGVLLLRLAVPGRHHLVDRIRAIFATEEVESWHGCFVVATDLKVRVRHPS